MGILELIGGTIMTEAYTTQLGNRSLRLKLVS